MAGFVYPVDVADLEQRLRSRGGGALQKLGISGDEREDVKLTAIVWGVGHGGFPVMSDGKTLHSGVDIGLPEVATGDPNSWWGADVHAIGDGEVIYAESGTRTDEGFDFGRVILRHQGPDGSDLFALYQHLSVVSVVQGGLVQQGEVLGQVGWHGDFPHLHFAVAAQRALGGDRDLVPESAKDALPKGDGVWNVLRVKVDALDANEWPGLPEGPFYLHNPIEVVRWSRGEEYLHDIGDGHLSRCALGVEAVGHDVQPGEDNAHQVDAILRSAPLKGCQRLVELAHDPAFAPLGKGYADKDVVIALQRALKKLGFDMGRFGPDRDGIDGDYGKTCVRVVTKFQGQLKQDAKGLAELGHTAEDVQESGSVDWLTLMALDGAALALEAAPAPKPPAPPADASPPPRPEPTPITAPPAAWVFDGVNKQLSVGFGLRLYQALMRWRFNDKGQGTGYSAAASFADYEVYKKECEATIPGLAGGVSEWPKLEAFSFLEPDDTVDLKGGAKGGKFNVFGVNWTGDGYTNCCNSQLAAFFVALGSRDMFVQRKASGDPVTYWAGAEDKKRYPGKQDQVITLASSKKKRAMAAFECVVVGNTDGIVAKADAGRGSGVLAAKLLDIGSAIAAKTSKGADYDGGYTVDLEVWRKARIGDWANYDHHSWLVGDICYGVWFSDEPAPKKGEPAPQGFINQSSLVGDSFAGLSATAAMSDDPGELSDEACDWATRNEAKLEERIESIYALAGKADVRLRVKGKKGETSRPVAKVQVVGIGVFSANGLWSTKRRAVHGKVYEMKTEFSEKADELAAVTKVLQGGKLSAKEKEKYASAVAPYESLSKDDKKAKLKEKRQELADLIRPADHWEDKTDGNKSWRMRGISNKWAAPDAGDPVAFARFYARFGGPPVSNRLSR